MISWQRCTRARQARVWPLDGPRMFPCLKICSHFQLPADSFDVAQRKAQRSHCLVTVLGCSELPAGRAPGPEEWCHRSQSASRLWVSTNGSRRAPSQACQSWEWRVASRCEALSKARNLATVVEVVQTVGLTFAVCEDQYMFEMCEYLFKGQFQSKSAWGCFCPDILGLKEWIIRLFFVVKLLRLSLGLSVRQRRMGVDGSQAVCLRPTNPQCFSQTSEGYSDTHRAVCQPQESGRFCKMKFKARYCEYCTRVTVEKTALLWDVSFWQLARRPDLESAVRGMTVCWAMD